MCQKRTNALERGFLGERGHLLVCDASSRCYSGPPSQAAAATGAAALADERSDALAQGAKLFADPALGANGKSCSTCHGDGAVWAGKPGFPKVALGGLHTLDQAIQICISNALGAKPIGLEGAGLVDQAFAAAGHDPAQAVRRLTELLTEHGRVVDMIPNAALAASRFCPGHTIRRLHQNSTQVIQRTTRVKICQFSGLTPRRGTVSTYVQAEIGRS